MGGRRRKRKVIRPLAYRWPNKTIPYEIDNGAFNGLETSILLESMAMWESNTCIRFRPSISSDKDILVFKGGTGCYSRVGRSGGRQDLVLAKPSCRKKKVVMHELGHALGLAHEHQRSDREDHVQINLQNVKPGYKEQFARISSRLVSVTDTKYDYTSLMHYGKTFFSVDKIKVTIQTIDPEYQDIIGRVETLSFTDFKAINNLFECSASCQSGLSCVNGGYVGPNCQCLCPPSVSSCHAQVTQEHTHYGAWINPVSAKQAHRNHGAHSYKGFGPFGRNYIPGEVVQRAIVATPRVHAPLQDYSANKPRLGQILDVQTVGLRQLAPQVPKEVMWHPTRGFRWNVNNMLSANAITSTNKNNNNKIKKTKNISKTRAPQMPSMANMQYPNMAIGSRVGEPLGGLRNDNARYPSLDFNQDQIHNSKQEKGVIAQFSNKKYQVLKQRFETRPDPALGAIKFIGENFKVHNPRKLISPGLRTMVQKTSNGMRNIATPTRVTFSNQHRSPRGFIGINRGRAQRPVGVGQTASRQNHFPISSNHTTTRFRSMQPYHVNSQRTPVQNTQLVVNSTRPIVINQADGIKQTLLREFQKHIAATDEANSVYALLKIPKEQAQSLLGGPFMMRSLDSGQITDANQRFLLTIPVQAAPITRSTSQEQKIPPKKRSSVRGPLSAKPIPNTRCHDAVACGLTNPMSCWSPFIRMNCPWSCGLC